MMKIILAIGTLCLPLAGQAAVEAMDPLKVGKSAYTLKAEDNDVRMMEVSFAPGQKMAMHEHPKHSIYVLQGGALKISREGQEAQVMQLKQGETVIMEAQKHEAQNTGKTRVKLLVTELKGK